MDAKNINNSFFKSKSDRAHRKSYGKNYSADEEAVRKRRIVEDHQEKKELERETIQGDDYDYTR